MACRSDRVRGAVTIESTVPFVDLTRRAAIAAPSFGDAVDRVMASGRYLLGAETSAFEFELAAHAARDSGVALEAVAVSSGASALQLALRGIGVGAGDEVIVPAFTAVPTAAAVCAVGATPVFVDVDEATACIDLGGIAAARTVRTKAIIVVHLYGYASPLPDTDLPVIEDCAQAHGALRWPRPAASRAVCLSFYPTKNLGGIGDGGAVLSSDWQFIETVRNRRVHSMEAGYQHIDVSMNFRLSEIEAAWLRIGLAGLDDHNRTRRAIADRYRIAAPALDWQASHENHVNHLAVVRVSDRDLFRAFMGDRGISTACQYPVALPDQPAYEKFSTMPTPISCAWARECVSMPCYPEMFEQEIVRAERALADWKLL